MRPDYKKVCWSCGSKNMEPVDTYYRCRDCGATYNVPLDLTFSPVTKIDLETGKAPRPGHPTRSRPSGLVSRAAAKKRAKSGRS